MSLNGFDDTITWSNFKTISTRPSGATEDAKMHWLLGFDNVKHPKGKGVSISSVDVYVKVYKEGSWVVESKKVDSLLAHEQGHYDIVAIEGRRLYRKLLSIKGKSVNDVQVQASDLHKKSAKNIEEVQIRYDNQTGRSQNSSEQQRWLKIIETTKKNLNGTLDDLPQ